MPNTPEYSTSPSLSFAHEATIARIMGQLGVDRATAIRVASSMQPNDYVEMPPDYVGKPPEGGWWMDQPAPDGAAVLAQREFEARRAARAADPAAMDAQAKLDERRKAREAAADAEAVAKQHVYDARRAARTKP